MHAQKAQPSKTEIEKAREHFDSWRRTKEYSSSPIPERLWQEAIGLAGVHSICEISKALGLDYNQLKRRVQRSEALVESPAAQTNAFVELSLSATVPQPEYIIELERPDKARMRMSIKGAVDPHLCDLAKTFWSLP